MHRAVRSVFLAWAILTGAACDDKGVTSPPRAPALDNGSAHAPPSTPPAQPAVLILKRTVALNSDVSASATIGPAGGTLSIPRAGITVEFPKGAVATRTLITATAGAGQAVAYEFEPHGLRFGAPVVVRQELVKTAAARDAALAQSLQGSYFEGTLAANLLDAAGSFAHIKESRKGKLKSSQRYLEFTIEHFSGYMVSTGFVSIDVRVGTEDR
jgi:hypothetical protein